MSVTVSSTAINNLTVPSNTGTLLDSSGQMVDHWRVTASITAPADDAAVTGWERVDETSSAIIGTGMTESSGVFTFPSTGIYFVSYTLSFTIRSADALVQVSASVTTDNSSYDVYSHVRAGNTSTIDVYHTASNFALIDVTDTSLVKFKLVCGNFSSDTNISGNTNAGFSQIYFMRVGDT